MTYADKILEKHGKRIEFFEKHSWSWDRILEELKKDNSQNWTEKNIQNAKKIFYICAALVNIMKGMDKKDVIQEIAPNDSQFDEKYFSMVFDKLNENIIREQEKSSEKDDAQKQKQQKDLDQHRMNESISAMEERLQQQYHDFDQTKVGLVQEIKDQGNIMGQMHVAQANELERLKEKAHNEAIQILERENEKLKPKKYSSAKEFNDDNFKELKKQPFKIYFVVLKAGEFDDFRTHNISIAEVINRHIGSEEIDLNKKIKLKSLLNLKKAHDSLTGHEAKIDHLSLEIAKRIEEIMNQIGCHNCIIGFFILHANTDISKLQYSNQLMWPQCNETDFEGYPPFGSTSGGDNDITSKPIADLPGPNQSSLSKGEVKEANNYYNNKNQVNDIPIFLPNFIANIILKNQTPYITNHESFLLSHCKDENDKEAIKNTINNLMSLDELRIFETPFRKKYLESFLKRNEKDSREILESLENEGLVALKRDLEQSIVQFNNIARIIKYIHKKINR